MILIKPPLSVIVGVLKVYREGTVSFRMDYTGSRPLNESEYQAMLSAFRGKYALRDKALFEIGVRTGFRISECLSIRISDIFQNGRMRDYVTVQKFWMKGKKKSRTLPLHSKCAVALQTWVTEAGFDVSAMPEQPLFCCQLTRKRLSRSQACDILKETARRAGLDVSRISSHSLRKTFATNMWKSPYVDRDMCKLARLLGHENYNNTLKYVLFLDGSLEKAVLLT